MKNHLCPESNFILSVNTKAWFAFVLTNNFNMHYHFQEGDLPKNCWPLWKTMVLSATPLKMFESPE